MPTSYLGPCDAFFCCDGLAALDTRWQSSSSSPTLPRPSTDNLEDICDWWLVNNCVDDHDYLSSLHHRLLGGYLRRLVPVMRPGAIGMLAGHIKVCMIMIMMHVCIYYNTSKYEDHEDHEDGEDDDYNDNYQNHATSLTWQLCQGFETACKKSSAISCTTFREPLRADHRLRSKMNLKSGPIWLEIWNLALFCLHNGYKLRPFTYPWLVNARSKHHLNYLPTALS